MTPERHRRLMELFDEVCDLPPEERGQAVARVRGEDAELGERLEGLLAADAAKPRDVTATARGKRTAREPLKQVGAFRLGRMLGEGGMGAVYEAEQDHPRRRVAVKILHAGTPAMGRRFHVEIATLARLSHPGIATILSAGEQDGRLYFAMELVDGERLDRHAARLPLAGRLALVARVCDAVHHAHQKGVIHRDLKPANILVCGDQPKVLDFGIARLIDADPAERATASGLLVGTPLYMSPEQTEHVEADARSDVYALGVIAYELAAGKLPYHQLGSMAQVMASIRTHDVEPLGSVRPELAGDAEVVIHKALAADPDARYASAAAFADDLRRYLADEPIAARPPALRTQVLRFARKNRALAATALALLVAIVAGATTTTVLFLRAERARRLLEARNRDLVLARARAELDVDPTRAVATLAPAGDAAAAQDLGRIAVDRGVARAVLVAPTEVRSVSFSPDGARLATAGYDHAVRVWDLSPGGGAEVRPLPDERVAFAWYSARGRLASGGPEGLRLWGPDVVVAVDGRAPVDAAVWSPDGTTLAVVAGGRVVLRRDGAAVATLEAPGGAVSLAAWSPGGGWIAGGAPDGKVWVWPAAGGAAIALGAHPDEITELAFADDDTLLSGSRDGQVRRSGVAARAGEVVEVAPHLKAIACGRAACAWGAHDGQITIWDRGPLRHARGHDGPVRTIAFAPDGLGFASGGDDGVVRVWDLATAAHADLRGHRSRVRMVAFSPDGKRLASAANDGEVRVWDAGADDRRLAHDGPVLALALASDGAAVATGGSDGRLRAFALARGRRAFAPGGAPVADTRFAEGASDVAFAGGRVVAAGRDRTVKVWDVSTGAVASLVAPARVVRVGVDGDRVAAATLGGAVATWNLRDGSERVLHGHAERVNDVRFLPDGRLLSAGDDRSVRVWDVATGDGSVLATCDDRVALLDVARDGTIAAASVDGTVRVLPGGRVLRGHEGRVRALAFAPDGRLATGGHDRGVRVWDPRTGEGARVAAHDAPVVSLAWAGDTLFSAGEDDQVVAWSAAAGARTVGPGRRVVAGPEGAGAYVIAAGDDSVIRLWGADVPKLDLGAFTRTER